jgi:ATP-dependent Clp endopeptidase proteolytic subunit ClpP
MRNPFAARLFAKRPELRALYSEPTTAEPRIEVRAAAAGTEILVYDEIGYWGVSARDFAKALADAGAGPITLRINSPGGDVFDGLAMFNAVRARGNVTTVVDGLAASMASILMLAGDSVAIQEAALVMIHRAWGLTIGNAEDHVAQAATLEKIDGQLAAIYAGRMGEADEAILALMSAETWFTSSEAESLGLVDTVIRPEPVQARMAAADPAEAREATRQRRERALRIAALR